jgi:hypothetical protein
VYGIGMGTNTPTRAGEEAGFVAETLGNRLQYFQVGNEADLYGRHLRDPKTWSARTYLQEWLTLARAIAAKVPAAKFGMPDVAGAVSWLSEISEQWPSILAPPKVTTLTHHSSSAFRSGPGCSTIFFESKTARFASTGTCSLSFRLRSGGRIATDPSKH